VKAPAPQKPPTKTTAPAPKRVRLTPTEAIVAAIKGAAEPVGKAEILAESQTDERDWTSARATIDADPDIVRLGAARGTRYTTRTYLAERVLAVLENADEDGLRKSEVLEALAEENLILDDELWTEAIQTLLADDRASKSGLAKGTRYHYNG
jgi:hypothetical protein